MKNTLILILIISFLSFSGCSSFSPAQITATTLPVYEFTTALCEGTGLSVSLLVTESVSCLHDYSLQVSQMRMIESAEIIILSGADLEAFLSDTLVAQENLIDASSGIELICSSHVHSHEEDHHEKKHEDAHYHTTDPHIWLSPANAIIMARNICSGLSKTYPQHARQFQANLITLQNKLTDLQEFGLKELSQLKHRELITFHDGFSYFAQAFDLTILEAVEEESGSEASAAELIALTNLILEHELPAIFTEKNGSTSAASVISAEAGVPCYELDMGLSGDGYFDAMYNNISKIKEAMG